MAKPITSVRDLISRWPSATVLADDLKVKPGRVRQWANRQRISSEFWAGMVESAKERGIQGVSTNLLARLHDGRSGADEVYDNSDTAPVAV